ncbi:MAG: amino acid aminotransferase [Bacteroidia bacterium]|nr:MAG: amino acid aminotransferase [Bacteroidia bacterium]
MTHQQVFINENFYAEKDAHILINDMAVQRGYGIFDFFKTLNGKPIFLDRHLNRFFNSAKFMHLPVAYSREKLTEIIQELMQLNQIENSGIRITLTGGYAADGYSVAAPNIMITQQPLNLNPPESIQLITHEFQRQLPHVKTIDYLMAVHLRPLVQAHQANEVLYCSNSEIRECPRANFFLVTPDRKIITQKDKILEGITRQILLEMGSVDDFTISTENISIDAIKNATEAFITSTTIGVQPVTAIDGLPVGNGAIGIISKKLQEKLKEKMFQN